MYCLLLLKTDNLFIFNNPVSIFFLLISRQLCNMFDSCHMPKLMKYDLLQFNKSILKLNRSFCINKCFIQNCHIISFDDNLEVSKILPNLKKNFH